MKITLIPLEELIVSLGIRSMSAILKEKGHDVSIIFIRGIIGERFSGNIIKQITDLCIDSDVIGISLMSNYFLQAIQLTQALKESTSALIIWGGVHPTFRPEECLKYADAVCIGEGESPMAELADKMAAKTSYTDTNGFWFSKKGNIVKNNLPILLEDLEKLPFPDYRLDGHYVRTKDKIEKMTKNLFAQSLTKCQVSKDQTVVEYYISMSRGCPFVCSYCASSSIKSLYPGQKYHRIQSIKKTINYVRSLISEFDFIKSIYFADDDIFSAPMERIQEFSREWKKHVQLPFYATCSPWSYSEEKIRLFANAGMIYFNLGIQSVTKTGCEVFNRKVTRSRLKFIIDSMQKFETLTPVYDFLVDNPYETDEDRMENFNFILDIPFPREIKVFSLIPFPGSAIYLRYLKDNLITDEKTQIYLKNYGRAKKTYINFLFYLSARKVPIKILEMLSHKILLSIFNNRFFGPIFFNISYHCSEPFILFLASMRAIRHLEFYKFSRFLKQKILGR
jgi:radical SAM superfamily enzyme YgiQ (UPF0313 family)